MKKLIIPLSVSIIIATSACSHKNVADNAAVGAQAEQSEMIISQGKSYRGGAIGYRDSKPVNAMPKATAFKMSGDYADNVAVTLGPNGEMLYFPAPTDISANSAPVDLGDGWWLNRQGIGAGSCFTKYTFKEYSALKKVPTQSELKEAIIPGAKVTEIRQLPFSASEAMQNLDSIRSFLKTPLSAPRLYVNPR